MPKLPPTEKQKVDSALNEYVAVHLLRQSMTKTQLAKAVGCERPTLWAKLKNPDKFTRGELRRLYKVLHFTKQEIIDSTVA